MTVSLMTRFGNFSGRIQFVMMNGMLGMIARSLTVKNLKLIVKMYMEGFGDGKKDDDLK
jgi:hypothetical protein